MLPNKLLKQRINEYGFSLESLGEDTLIKFIATNLKTAHTWDHTWAGFHPSLNFSYSDGDPRYGIIILQVSYNKTLNKNRASDHAYLILEVSNGRVNLEKYWEQKVRGRIIMVKDVYPTCEAFIELTSESDKRYTTNPQPAPGEYYVPDAALLCKFVSGLLKESALQDAATLQVEEKTRLELLTECEGHIIDLQLLIKKLQKKLEIQDENVAMFTAKFEQARGTIYLMRDKLERAMPLVGWWYKKICKQRLQSAIDLADKEIPRQQRNPVLTRDDKVIPQ